MKRSIAASLLLASSFTAMSASAQDAPYDPNAEVDEVISTGIVQSLEAAADLKRLDSRIVDAIVAEDIGKLPDNNIAEALQRVTGVAINRDFGVGDSVSIRGLPQNRVEINGRSTLGTGRNGISFQDVPSEILSAIEVIKSPTPKMIEGALGGTINLKTSRPLDLKDRVLAFSAKGEYTDKSKNLGPILNATAGDNWTMDNGGTFGAIVNLSYQDRTLAEGEYRSSLEVSPYDFDNTGTTTNYIDPRNYAIFYGEERRERLAGNLSLQYAPASGNGMIYAEATYADRSGYDETFSPNIIDNSVLQQDGEIAAGFRIDDTRQLVGFFDNDAVLINRTESGFRNTDSLSGAIGGEWEFDRLSLAAEVSYAKSDTDTPYQDLRFWGVNRAAQTAAQAEDPLEPGFTGNPERILRSNDVTVFYDTDNDSLPIVALANPELWLDRSQLALRRYERRLDQVDNEETALRFDASYDTEFGFAPIIKSIDAGIRTTSRDYESSRDRLFVSNLQRELVRTSTGERLTRYMDEFPTGTIQDFDVDAFRNPSGPFDLTRFSMFDPSLLREEGRIEGILAGLLADTNKAGVLAAGLVPDQGRFAGIKEDTLALYGQVNFEGNLGANVPFSAVAGVRYVETDLESTANQRIQGNFEPTTDENSYEDWLPSINVKVEPAEDLLVRLAFGEVLRRPDFGQLSPALNVNQDAVFATRGNPQLEPFRATQYDASIEKYWGEANLVSAAVFYKDVSSFFDETEICLNAPSFVAISNPNRRDELCFLDGRAGNPVNPNDPGAVADPDSALGIPTEIQVNGDSGSIKGFELGYQQTYDFLPGLWSGLGLAANYTYADSEDPNGRQLEDISKNTVNVTGFYEKNGFGARLAYTYRSRFLDDILNGRVRQLGSLLTGTTGVDATRGNSFREPIKQLDASVSYDINDNFTIQADAVNLTGEQIFDTGVTGTLWRVLESDRRYTIGVRGRF